MKTSQHTKKIVQNMIKKAGVGSQAQLAHKLGVSPQAVSDAIRKAKIPDQWFIKFQKKYGITKDELIKQADDGMARSKIAATITPGQMQIANELPTNNLTPLKLLVAWMNETFTGDIGEVQAMQFYESIKRDFPSFRQFIEKRQAGEDTAPDAENVA